MRVLVLTSSTGGGHDMRARALNAWIESCSTESAPLHATIFQTLEGTHALYRFGVFLYNFIQRRVPAAHRVYFPFLELAGFHRNASMILGRHRFLGLVSKVAPDLVVSTHAHLNHGYFTLARRCLSRNLPCVTYCGELSGGYGFSRHWVNPGADLFVGADPDTCAAALRLGQNRKRIWNGGFLLDPSFYAPAPSVKETQALVQDELNLNPENCLIVLSTGANGANNHLAFLNSLARQRIKVQVVALCGDRKQVIHDIERWGRGQDVVTVRPLPYFNRMHLLMHCASAIVARPGTGTTSEAIMAGCPIIFNGCGGIMPQEALTLEFARRHGIDRIVRRACDLPGIVSAMRSDCRETARAREQMQALQPELRPGAIIDRLRELGRTPGLSASLTT